jgi:phospholipid transport system transporter-binding protein
MAWYPVSLTMHNAEDGLQSGLEAIARGTGEIDLSRLEHFDSAVMAALLAWRRAAQSKGLALRILGAPSGVQSLARLYGVAELLEI